MHEAAVIRPVREQEERNKSADQYRRNDCRILVRAAEKLLNNSASVEKEPSQGGETIIFKDNQSFP